ncbi:MAG: DUF6067 family protein, partial [Armatimonadetes bacterium]|nr:DUF6067 family protein [Armatimonadota bacterium]
AASPQALAQTILPSVTVPRLKNSPRIDGVIGQEEWGRAAMFSAFKELRSLFPAPLATSAYLGYDEKNIYLAFRCAGASGAAFKASTQDHDGPVWEDDSVEVFLSSDGGKSYAHIIVNALGALLDEKGFDRSFESGTQCAARTHDDRWECEVAIPMRALTESAPRQGTKWLANFCRNAFVPTRGSFTWAPCLWGYHEPNVFGELVFGDELPSVRVGELAPGRGADWGKASVLGADAEAHLRLFKGRQLLWSGKKPLRDGRLSHPVLADCCLGTHELTVELNTKSGRRLYADSIFFDVRPSLPVTIRKFFFGERKAYISLDLKACALPGAVAARFSLLPKNKPMAVWETTARPRADGMISTWFSTANLSAGDYRLSVALLNAAQKVLKRAEIPFRKPPTPVWYGNRLGKSEKVPQPWLPVRVQGKAAIVWGRTYRFNDLALPESIASGGVELLAAPVRLTGVALKPGKPLQLRRLNESACRATATAYSSSDLRAEITTITEFDGFTRTDLRLVPRKPVRVAKLHLEIPVRRQVAMLYWHYCLEGYRWERQDLWPNGGFLPEKGWRGPFTAAFWLGDRERGLQWYAESPKEWRLTDRQQAIEVLPQSDAAVLRIRLIDRPSVIRGTLTYTWGVMATPVKPLPPDWRKQRYTANCGYGAEKKFFPSRSRIIFPLEDNLEASEGTVELEICPQFDTEFQPPSRPEFYHQSLLVMSFPDASAVALYWNSEVKSLRLYHAAGGGFPILFDSYVRLQRGKWHRVGFTWGRKVSLWIDGVEVVGARDVPLPSRSLKGARLMLGDGQWLVRNLRVSKVARDPTPEQPIIPDANTTMFSPLDEVVDKRVLLTRGKGAGVVESVAPVGAVEAGGLKALKLDPYAVRLSFIEYARQFGLRYGHIHEDWSDIQSHPDTIYEDRFASLARACKKAGVGLTPYFSHEISDRSPLWEDYGDEFVAVAPDRIREYIERGPYARWPRQFVYGGNHATTPYGDFLIWGIVQLIKRYDIGGIYMDGLAYPTMGDNPYTGLGYVTEDGKRYPSVAVFGSREFLKRLYIACKTLKPDFYFRSHSSGGPFMPTMSFVSTYFNGEQLGNFPSGYHLPMDRYWAEFYGRNFGFIADVYPTHRVNLFEATCFNILHDVLQPADWPGNYFPAMAIWELQDEFGVEKSRFVPFFNNDGAVTSSHEDVKVSYYVGPSGVLLAVANMSPSERADALLTLSPEKLSLARDIYIRKVVGTGSHVKMADEKTVELTLEPFRWHLIWLRGQ